MTRRRHLILATLSLVLGLLTTIGLAWALARFRPLPMYPRTLARAFILEGRAWATAEVHLLGAADIWWDDLASSAAPLPTGKLARALARLGALNVPPSSKTPQELLDETRKDHVQLAQERPWFTALDTPPSWGTFAQSSPLPAPGTLGEDAAFGFPLPCLWYRVQSQLRGNASVGATLEHGLFISGTPNARGTGGYIALPLKPIWPALAVDVAAFTCVWWLLLAGPAIVRRAIRRRRGQCGACGYDLRATPPDSPCPECGTATLARGILSP